MDIFAAYATVDKAEEEGVWCQMGDVEFLIARQGNSRYSRMFTLQFEKNRVILEAKDTEEQRQAAEKLSNKIFIELASKALLLGWRGRDLGEGQVGKVKYKGVEYPEFDVAVAQQMLSHKDFLAWVNTQASKLSNYLVSAQEADEKNSVTSSTGSLSGEANSTA